MRRYLFIGYLVLYSACAYAFTNLSPETTHFVGLWGGLGYAGWLHTQADVKPLSGVTPSIGFGYRVVHNRFLFQTGLEGQYTWVQGRFPEINRQEWMNDQDIPNEQFLMNVRLYDYKDVTQTVHVQIPILLGCEVNRFFMLAGLNAGFGVYASTSSKAAMKTMAEYDKYIGIMENIPNHGLKTESVSSGSRRLNMGLNLAVHLEAGSRVDRFNPKRGFNVHNHSYRVYLSAFAEYGVINVHPSTSQGPFVSLDFTSGVKANMTPFMLCDEMKDAKVNPLTVGLKCTLMFELPQSGKSFVYDYYQVDRDYRKRGGTQSIKY